MNVTRFLPGWIVRATRSAPLSVDGFLLEELKIRGPPSHWTSVSWRLFHRSSSTRPTRRLRGLILSAIVCSTGCMATLGDNDSDKTGADDGTSKPVPGTDENGLLSLSRDAVASACEARQGVLGIGVTKLRRLSVLEFNNTVQSILGGSYVDYSPNLPDDEPMGPFVSNQSLTVGIQEARQYKTVAEHVAESALAQGPTFLPCSLPEGAETECIEQFIDEVVPRAFRRPLVHGEADDLLNLYVVGRDGVEGDFADPERGLRLLLRGIFGSPDLLYIVDTGESGIPGETPESVGPHTLASRLTLAFWNAPPDEELMGLASSGKLLDEDVFAAQVDRVLADPRARNAVAHFFAQLTGVTHLSEKEKDPGLFPEWGDALVEQMLAEQAEFVSASVFDGDGLFRTLLLENHTNPGPQLVELYGVAQAPPVTLPTDQRQGLFTQAAYLAAHNKPEETSPVHLGINIREAILCETMDPPPANVDTTLPEVSGEIRTSRDRFLAHEIGPCKGCHQLIDPIGLAFEHYDAIGRYRETDNGAPIDPTGQIIGTGDREDGPPFTGALELSQQLAESEQVQDCVSRQLLRSALDRQESLHDACTALEVIEAFDESGGNIRDLLARIAQTEAFRHIVLNPPESE